jgi:hypothetical protein
MAGGCATNETSGTPDANSPKETGTVHGTVYSRYNLHYYVRGINTRSLRMAPHPIGTGRALRRVCIASYANFTDCPGHSFVPYNTRFRIGRYRNGFSLALVGTRLQIYFEYDRVNMQGISEKEYLRTITSPTPVKYEGLNAKDEEGVTVGKALVGMTRQGVMVALGYPAKRATPSLDSNIWRYWKGRGDSFTVNFSRDGLVESFGE